MKHLLFFIGLLVSGTCLAQSADRTLKTVTFRGGGYELGLQHGKALKTEIAAIIEAWKKNTAAALGKDADEALEEFYQYAQFEEAIRQWTPNLYEEVRGIADGANQDFKDVLVLNLLDEFWVYVNTVKNVDNHHCSAVGVPAAKGNPGYISQNMDLEAYTDGFQVLMRLEKTKNTPERLILTYPGLVALNGMNEKGMGVCVNTLMQLEASATGLPVAFVIRRLIDSSDKKDMLNFIQTVKHASGQNYIVGIRGEVYDFEASANKVVRFDPKNENGTVYHTNHPMVNDDIKPWFKQYDPLLTAEEKPTDFNSYYRLQAVEERMATASDIDETLITETLQSKDHPKNPVCRANRGGGFTFSSIVMTMADSPFILITAGPPDESDYQRFDFDE